MKQIKLLSLIGIVGLLVACGGADSSADSQSEEQVTGIQKMNVDELNQEVLRRVKAVAEDSTGDRQLAKDLLEAYAVFGERFPNRANSAEYIFKAGEIAMNLNQTAKAIKLFTTVFDDYKDYEKRPYALFMKAFVIENQAENYPEATIYYKDFIRMFPDHPMADDAQYSIENMGKSPETLIREFEIRDSIQAAQGGA